MLLFLYICLGIIAIIVIFALIVLLSEIRLVIIKNENFNQIKVQLFFLGKIKWFSYRINGRKIKGKLNINNIKSEIGKLRMENKKLTIKKRKERNKVIKSLIIILLKKVRVRKLNTEIIIGTSNEELTSYLTGIIYAVVPNIVKNKLVKFSKENYNLIVYPIYQNINTFNIKLNCIFSIKIVHIINMLEIERKEIRYI